MDIKKLNPFMNSNNASGVGETKSAEAPQKIDDVKAGTNQNHLQAANRLEEDKKAENSLTGIDPVKFDGTLGKLPKFDEN